MLLLTPVLLLALIIRSTRQTAYRHRLIERLGILPKGLAKGGLIIHASSVGEVLALKALVQKLLLTHPETPITFTTFTPTGSEQVKKLFGDRVQHVYLPIDNPLSSYVFLKTLAPKSLVVMETELWPNLIQQARHQGIHLQLINGRLSNNSMKSYRKLTWLITPCLQNFDDILCQSIDNQENFLALGAPTNITQVSGNLKYDIVLSEDVIEKQQQLDQLITTKRPVWLVASTHPGDEKIVLGALSEILKTQPDLLLILVPRHPERFEEIATLCQAQFNTVRRSTAASVLADHQVWLLDSLGELMAAFKLADVVTMGGSFSQVGGHNPLEPAFYHKPIIVGPNMSNFKQVMTNMLNGGAIIQLTEGIAPVNYQTQLSEQVCYLLANPERSQALGDNARKVVNQNQGALVTTHQKISQHLVN
ncbi:lipid IV(A) 3-deoxy-D-manno-octulosonic acid transferase [Thalassotalea sp. LPB0316]|nr:lipid IV(A) 3-deoxy-D-manno-octulosonic acid transferase [Thalassotalea sp. LPB0316]